jgi:hypothetical protein
MPECALRSFWRHPRRGPHDHEGEPAAREMTVRSRDLPIDSVLTGPSVSPRVATRMVGASQSTVRVESARKVTVPSRARALARTNAGHDDVLSRLVQAL